MTSKKIDYILLCSVLALVVIGLVFVYSASSYSAEIAYGNKYFFFTKQAIGALVGLVAMLVASKINIDFIKKLWIAGIVR